VLHQLRDAGNTIVVIEHNLDVIKTADWVVDMGPEGGAGGGQVVGRGTPEQVAANPASYTGATCAAAGDRLTCHRGAPLPGAGLPDWP
jgi:excinuclease UvrABC ATPase subunit